MASDGNPGKISGTSLVQGSQAVPSVGNTVSGKSLPSGGRNRPPAAAERGGPAAQAARDAAAAAAATLAKAPPLRNTDPQTLVTLLNKFLNDSGRPDQFRIDPNSRGKLIQQINPATGEVIGEYPVSEFPALARSIGASGLLIDRLA
jgi:FlaG protein